MTPREAQAHGQLVRLEAMASNAADGRACELVLGDEVQCLVRYSRAMNAARVYWRHNGDRVSERTLQKRIKHLAREVTP